MKKGERVGVVGEWGWGKRMRCLCIMGVVEGWGGKMMKGWMKVEGGDVVR